jgi:hypothetical protein
MLLCTFISQAVNELLMKHNSLSAERMIIHSCYENYYVAVINHMHYIIHKISSANIVNLSPFNSLCVCVCLCVYILNKSTFDVMN